MPGSVSRRFLALLIATCAVGLVAPAAAPAGTLDQQQTDNGGSTPGISSSASEAQTFTAGISGGLDRVDLSLEVEGSSGSVIVEIRNTSGVPGVPGTALAGGAVPGSAVPGTQAFVQFTVNPPAPVTAGTEYAIVAYTSGGALDRWALSTAADPYVQGAPFASPGAPPTGPWTSNGNGHDLAFKTYVVPTPPATGERAAALKKCKKKHSARARRKCRKKARLLPV
jgi:hypothetical protein